MLANPLIPFCQMKRFSICLFLTLISNAAGAQYTMNSFLRQNQDAIRVSNRIEDLSKMVNGDCIYNVKNLFASTSGSMFYLTFNSFLSNFSDLADASVEKMEINMRTVDVYTGTWYPNYKQPQHHSSESRQIVTFRDDKNSIVQVSTGQKSYNQGTKRWPGQGFRIKFPTESAAQRFIELFRELQKPYREYMTWEEPDETDAPTSLSVSEIFNSLSKDFIEYDIISAQVHWNKSSGAKTTQKSMSFEYHYLIIQYNDQKGNSGGYSSFEAGKRIIKIPTNDVEISYSTNSVSFSSGSGIEISYNGGKDLQKSVAFFGSELVCKRICTEAKQFVKKVKDERFTGKLGSSVTSSSGTSSGRSQSSSGSSTSSSVSLPNKYNGARYSISYPNGWSYLENVQGADVYIGANDGSIAFTILSFSTPYSLDEVMEEANTNAARAGWKKTNTSTTLCGVKCYKSTVTYTYNGMAVKQIQYTLKKNGYVYNLNFGNDASKVNANSSLISNIANSFKIK